MTLTPAQLERRQEGIGASEIAAVCGVDPYRTAIDVYLQKTGQVEPFEGNEFTLWGNRLEAVIADEYATRQGVIVRPSETLQHGTHSWILATPDRMVFERDDAPAVRLLECKNRNYFDWRNWGAPGTDEVPVEIAAQAQWQMGVTALRRCDVAVLLGGNRMGVYVVEFDQETFDVLMDRAFRFWTENVQARVTPALDGSASSTRYLNQKWSIHGSDLKPATPEVIALAQNLRNTRALIAQAKVEQAGLENLIKDFIGEQSGVEFPNHEKITWKRPKSTTRIDWQMVAAGLKGLVPEEQYQTLVGLHTTETPGTRRFLTPRNWSKETDHE